MIFRASFNEIIRIQVLTDKPTRSAADWFADALLHEWVPEENAAEIIEHMNLVLGAPLVELQKPFLLYGAGLFCAQAIYWKLARPKLQPVIQEVADVFLRFKPENPTVARMRALINELAALTIPYRLVLAEDQGLEVWCIEITKGGTDNDSR